MLNFLGIGAQKAGTTWLYSMLKRHPALSFPAGKEIHFWDRQRARGIDWYRGLFATSSGTLQGEITPAYAMLDEEVIGQVHALNPELRILYVLRNPMERAWSSALMRAAELELDPQETPDEWYMTQFRLPPSLKRGDYETCLRNWRAKFGEQAIKVLLYERLVTDPLGFLEEVAAHLGISPEPFRQIPRDALFQSVQPFDIKSARGAQRNPPIRLSLRPPLRAMYRHKIESLEHYLGWSPGTWLPDTAHAQPAATRAPATPTESPRSLLVLGMPSIGMARIADALRDAGIAAGGADRARAAHLNETVLNRNGGTWNCPPTGPVRWEPAQAKARDRLLERRDAASPWALVDPGTLLTLDGWLDACRGASLLGVFRSPARVARALMSRHAMSRIEALELWLHYNHTLLHAARRHGFRLFDLDTPCTALGAAIQHVLKTADAPRVRVDPAAPDPDADDAMDPGSRLPVAPIYERFHEALRGHRVSIAEHG